MDYEETFDPITICNSIRAIMSITSEMGWMIHLMDVKTTFVNGVIKEEVYID